MKRRRLLTLGVAGVAAMSAAAGVATGTAMWFQPGLERGALTPFGRHVFRAVGLAVLEQSLPVSDPAREMALDGLLYRIDALISNLPQHTQQELSQLLSLLSNPVGRLGLAGLNAPWAQASVFDAQNALQSMRISSLAARQQAYAALHDVAAGAYFSDVSSWQLLGYPGPLKI